MNNGWQGGQLSRRRFALALPLLGAVAWASPRLGAGRRSRNVQAATSWARAWTSSPTAAMPGICRPRSAWLLKKCSAWRRC